MSASTTCPLHIPNVGYYTITPDCKVCVKGGMEKRINLTGDKIQVMKDYITELKADLNEIEPADSLDAQFRMEILRKKLTLCVKELADLQRRKWMDGLWCQSME